MTPPAKHHERGHRISLRIDLPLRALRYSSCSSSLELPQQAQLASTVSCIIYSTLSTGSHIPSSIAELPPASRDPLTDRPRAPASDNSTTASKQRGPCSHNPRDSEHKHAPCRTQYVHHQTKAGAFVDARGICPCVTTPRTRYGPGALEVSRRGGRHACVVCVREVIVNVCSVIV